MYTILFANIQTTLLIKYTMKEDKNMNYFTDKIYYENDKLTSSTLMKLLDRRSRLAVAVVVVVVVSSINHRKILTTQKINHKQIL